jgi:hypothetical protein
MSPRNTLFILRASEPLLSTLPNGQINNGLLLAPVYLTLIRHLAKVQHIRQQPLLNSSS